MGRRGKSDTIRGKERTRSVIIRFAVITSLNRLKWNLKLGTNVSMKVFKRCKDIGFSVQ